jgi:hypothetical protein
MLLLLGFFLAMAFLVESSFGYDVRVPGRGIPEKPDSMKIYITYQSGTTIIDSTAGAARMDKQSYDTTLTGFSADSAYWIDLAIWYTGEPDSVPITSSIFVPRKLTGTDLVDLIWDEDTTGHKTDPNMGFWITQGGSAVIDDADMGAIADSTWQKIADITPVTGSYGDSALGWGATAASAFDPATDSVLVDVSAAQAAGGLIALLTEEVWRNIDTTNVDTSLIGKWLTTAGWIAATRTLTTADWTTEADLTAITAQVATAVKDSASNNPSIFYGPTASGSGANTVVIWAVDSTTNDTLPNVNIAVRNTSGTLLGNQNTGAAGNATFNLDDGTYHIIATATGYTFPVDTTAISGSPDTTAVEGDYYSPSAPAGGNLCTVNGFIQDHQEVDWAYATLTFTMPKNVSNSCDSAVLLRRSYTCETNSSGYFEIPLLVSPCIDSAKWQVVVSDGGGEKTTAHNFFIPSDSSTFRLFWEP